MDVLEFPQVEEIRLQHPPLSEVICQVKFPSILKIEKDIPSEFQEAIKTRFPNLQTRRGMTITGPDKQEISISSKEYLFQSSDIKTTAALSTEFLALSTQTYSHWLDFLGNFQLVFNAFNDLYQPPTATRLGLRFVNRFTCPNTSCEDLGELTDLFRPELTALLRTSAWQQPVESFNQIILQEGEARLGLRIAYGVENDLPFVVLDLDYYEEKQTPFRLVMERLEHYHDRLYAAFRWCVKDHSLARFGPLQEN